MESLVERSTFRRSPSEFHFSRKKYPAMTALLTRLRPLAPHSLRVRSVRQHDDSARSGFAAAEERLATRSKIEMLRTMYAGLKV